MDFTSSDENDPRLPWLSLIVSKLVLKILNHVTKRIHEEEERAAWLWNRIVEANETAGNAATSAPYQRKD